MARLGDQACQYAREAAHAFRVAPAEVALALLAAAGWNGCATRRFTG